ncbi:hypothetical protein Nepgr_003202 [Nepenthes gracilis]|uniref:Uncharacterized protein n=1 Tax=Nepenthes gracilis TaxID=150966 RepID=A0AAD3XD57_NEPGR|nr:hypothetical protein Nepgr_003202 [Nepenthes gracilis]
MVAQETGLQSLSSISNPSPNPNPNLSSISSGSIPPNPGIDPHASISDSYPAVHGNFLAQTSCYHDPNAAAQHWVVKQAAPIKYSTVIRSMSGIGASTSSNSLWNLSCMYQAMMSNISKRKPKPMKVSQAIRCDLCNIDCNSIDVYQKHISGKKHNRNLQGKYSSGSMSSLQISQLINNGCTLGQTDTNVAQSMLGVPSAKSGEDLDRKKQKLVEGGTSVDSVKVCATCNVVCNSEIVFADHLAGKKHSAQTDAATNNSHAKGTEKGPKDVKNVQSIWCEACQVSCNSDDVFIIHKLGKKHQKNLEKLQNSESATTLTNCAIGPVKSPQSSNAYCSHSKRLEKKAVQIKIHEDLETKKRKIMESGVAADAVRTCTMCNVVCPSEIVFRSHLAGQKHAAMQQQKNAEVEMGYICNQLVTEKTKAEAK